jgi:3-hydroxybutyryl-CoA dehydrogenase
MVRKIRKVSIVGTGILGTQIAVQAGLFGYEVAAYDIDKEAFHHAHQGLRTRLETGMEKGIFTLDQWASGAEKVGLCHDLKEALKNADLVIEAVSEDLEVKRKVFKSIDAFAPQWAILATNSSSIPISKIESTTKRPGQCLNIHFYYPLMGINMVELMGGTKTAAEVFEASKKWVRSIGCVPLTVKKEIFGFCFNRIWRAIKREALHIWAEGFVDFMDIDRAWMIFHGTPHGPFGLMDRVGLDVVYDIEMVYFNESKDPKDHPPEALRAKIELKELGVKTGKGFYIYPNPEYARSDFLKG